MKKEQSPSSGIGYFPEAKNEAPARKPRLSLPRRLLLALCALVFCVSAFLLVRYFASIAASRRAADELNEIVEAYRSEPPVSPLPTAAPTAAPEAGTPARAAETAPTVQPDALWPTVYENNPSLRVSAMFSQLRAKNRDICAWMKIDGVLEETVVQRDNVYYLTHNVAGRKNVTGALFIDEDCDLRTVPGQVVVYGHNMKEGSMFGSLMKYKVKGAAFYRAHPYIEFNTMYEDGRYVIFAAADVDLRTQSRDYLPFWTVKRFGSAEQFETYIRRIREVSELNCPVDVVPGDRLLTLVTCVGQDDNRRFAVFARRVRADEDTFALTNAIAATGNK